MTSPVAYVNKALAPYYGLSAASFTDELKATTLDANQRPGFLTRAGFLNAFAAGTYSNPIKRGAFVMKDVLGIDPGSPPPGAEMTPLPDASATVNTNRKRFEALSALASNCMSCHVTYINPPGFAMEAYDAAGAWQTKERVSGAPIDTVVDAVIDGQTVHITNPAELMARIAASPSAQKGYASKWVSFAFNRANDPADVCTVEQLTYKMNSQTYPVLTLIKDLTLAPSFRVRALISG
jgi:antitoxin (DNA-binding transcriptional repressor) of toxin-antitoxin stability system